MNSTVRLCLFIAFFLLISSVYLQAQIPADLNQNIITSPDVGDTLNTGLMPLDTQVTMTYVLIGDPDKHYAFRDTFEWADAKHHPYRFDQGHLGNYGSPNRPLAPAMSYFTGFSTGWDQYDPYFIQPDSFKYYHQDIPVADIKYSQSGQEETYISLDFGKRFAKGLSLSISYDRTNQVGEYAHQRQKNTAFGVGIWHNSPSGKYDAFYNYISNATDGEENGGIAEPDSIGSPRIPDPSVPVFILHGLSIHKHRNFVTRQIFHLVPDSASLGFDLWFRAAFSTGLYKYVDENPDTTNGYYGPEYLFDQRGIRQFTYEEESQYSAGIALPWTKARSNIQTSLRYRSILLQQEPNEEKINELFWEASGDFHWIKAIELKGQMSLGLGEAGGSFLFRADGILNSGVLGNFSGYWSIMGRRPYLVESSLYVNQQPIYQKNLNDPLINDVGVSWKWDKQKLLAGVNWMVFDNYIYFDTMRQPAQLNSSFSLRRFSVNKEFDLKWIGMTANVIWQPDAKEELAIPDLIYTAGFYGRLKIFDKKLTLVPGIDITYHDGFRGLSYFPVVGRYHHTNGASIPEYFRIDAAISMKIKFLTAFVRMDDVVGLWKTRVLYQADYYPHFPGYFRIGIEAGFFN